MDMSGNRLLYAVHGQIHFLVFIPFKTKLLQACALIKRFMTVPLFLRFDQSLVYQEAE